MNPGMPIRIEPVFDLIDTVSSKTYEVHYPRVDGEIWIACTAVKSPSERVISVGTWRLRPEEALALALSLQMAAGWLTENGAAA